MSITHHATRRSLLAGIPAVAAAMAPGAAIAFAGLPTQPAGDPIFAAIERHRAAVVRFDAFLDGTNDVEIKESGRAAWDAYWFLLETPPPTTAGFVALFTYLAEKDEYGSCNLIAAIDCWDGNPPGQTEHLHASEWLEMLAAAMRKLQVEAQA
jgi:hypothetical protein